MVTPNTPSVGSAGDEDGSTGPDISLSNADSDVAKSVLNVRLAMQDVSQCNLHQLGRMSRILSQEANNLMDYQGWVFG